MNVRQLREELQRIETLGFSDVPVCRDEGYNEVRAVYVLNFGDGRPRAILDPDHADTAHFQSDVLVRPGQ